MEGVVQALGADVDDEGGVVGGGGDSTPPALRAPTAGPEGSSPTGANDQGRGDREKETAQAKKGACPNFADADPRKMHPRKLDQEFGRLVVDDGKSRYVSNRFWASLGDEVCILKIFTSYTTV